MRSEKGFLKGKSLKQKRKVKKGSENVAVPGLGVPDALVSFRPSMLLL